MSDLKKSEVFKNMQEKIQPKYNVCTAYCACGAKFETASTKKEIRVDVCSKCHPFFTGQQRNLAARGRIEKFNKRYGK